VLARLDEHRASCGRAGLAVCALDTELLGHWWYEGPQWLEAVVEEAHRSGLELGTLPAALERHEPRQGELGESSWAIDKSLETWDSPEVAEIVWAARRSELALCAALNRPPATAEARASGERAARELLAIQSSDWAFMITRRLAGTYPLERARGHAEELGRALGFLRLTMEDSRPMADSDQIPAPQMRGLAPWLSLKPLLGPSSVRGNAESGR
jgi:1,4-alpha-glucan branching enzyme